MKNDNLACNCGSGIRRSVVNVGMIGTALLLSVTESRSASNVSMAALAIGRLYVVGTTDKPHTSVTLDMRFHSTSDEAGKFSFEEIYHPVTCVVGVDIEGATYRAVVSNCAQQMPTGSLPFVGAAFPDMAATQRFPLQKPKAVLVHPMRPKPKPRVAPARVQKQEPASAQRDATSQSPSSHPE